MTNSIIPYFQIILSVILVVLILIQRSDASLGSAFGGGDSESSKFVRRGFEKTLFQITIAIAVLFALSAVVGIIL